MISYRYHYWAFTHFTGIWLCNNWWKPNEVNEQLLQIILELLASKFAQMHDPYGNESGSKPLDE